MERRKYQEDQQHEGRTEERNHLKSLNNKWGLEAFQNQSRENELYYQGYLEKKKVKGFGR